MGWQSNAAMQAGAQSLRQSLIDHAYRIAKEELSEPDRRVLAAKGIDQSVCAARIARHADIEAVVGDFMREHSPDVPFTTDPHRDVVFNLPPGTPNPLVAPMREVLQAALASVRGGT